MLTFDDLWVESQHLSEEANLKWSMLIGLFDVIITTALIVGPFKHLFLYVYILKYLYLCPTIFFRYKQRNNHYFFLDFCWNFGNWIVLAYIWLFPTYEKLFPVAFGAAAGVLFTATVLFKNMIVFHNMNRMTTCFLHMYPMFAVYLIRYYLSNEKYLSNRGELRGMFNYNVFTGRPFEFSVLHLEGYLDDSVNAPSSVLEASESKNMLESLQVPNGNTNSDIFSGVMSNSTLLSAAAAGGSVLNHNDFGSYAAFMLSEIGQSISKFSEELIPKNSSLAEFLKKCDFAETTYNIASSFFICFDRVWKAVLGNPLIDDDPLLDENKGQIAYDVVNKVLNNIRNLFSFSDEESSKNLKYISAVWTYCWALPLLYYMSHNIVYLTTIYFIFPIPPGFGCGYRLQMTKWGKNPIFRNLPGWTPMRPWAPPLYWFIGNNTAVAIMMLPVGLWYASYVACSLFMLLILGLTIFNTASYYVDIIIKSRKASLRGL